MIGTVALYFVSAFVTVTALFFTLQRVMPLRVVLGYAAVIDVVFSSVMLYVFAGTFTGLFSATLAGLFLAITLTAGRAIFGYQTLKLVNTKAGRIWILVEHPGKVVCGLDWLARFVKEQAHARNSATQ